MREERQPPLREVSEVAPGVLRVQLPMNMPGLGHVNCYAIEDRKGISLIDPGMPHLRSLKVLKARLAEVGLPINRTHTVIVTHSHPDHYGAGQRLRDLYGAELVTHENFKTYWDPHEEDDFVREVAVPGEYDAHAGLIEGALLKITHRQRHSPWDRPLPWGGKAPDSAWRERLRWRIKPLLLSKVWQPPKPSTRVVDGEVILLGDREWVAVFTPGHTNDHLCLLEPNDGTFVSGDHLLPTITPHISGLTTQKRPLADFLLSLQRMETFDGVRTVLPAHGLVFSDLHGRSKEIAHHHDQRLATLTQAAAHALQHELSVPEFSRHLFKPHAWGTMADSETFAHLEYLYQQGKATARILEGQLLYRITAD